MTDDRAKMSDDRAETRAERKRVRRRRVKRLWRKAGDSLGLAFYLLASGLVGVTGWAAYANIVKSGWSSDAAAWVQAAGSIAAIAGAAWLAQSGARRARRLRREQNEEAAWYVLFAIKQAQFESQIIAAELVNRTTPIDKDDMRGWRQRATTSAVGLTALADRTDHIHPAVTQVTSNAKVLMDDLVADLAVMGRLIEQGREPDEEMISRIVAPHRALLELINLYDSRMQGVTLALEDGDDALPIRNWAAWRPDAK